MPTRCGLLTPAWSATTWMARCARRSLSTLTGSGTAPGELQMGSGQAPWPAGPSRSCVGDGSAGVGAWLRGDLRAAETTLAAAAEAPRGLDPLEGRRVVQQSGELSLPHARLADAVASFAGLRPGAQRRRYPRRPNERRQRRAAPATAADKTKPNPKPRQKPTLGTRSQPSPSFAKFVQGEVAALDGSRTAEAHRRSSIEHAESVGNSFIAGLARVTLATVSSRRADTATALERVPVGDHRPGSGPVHGPLDRSPDGFLPALGEERRRAGRGGPLRRRRPRNNRRTRRRVRPGPSSTKSVSTSRRTRAARTGEAINQGSGSETTRSSSSPSTWRSVPASSPLHIQEPSLPDPRTLTHTQAPAKMSTQPGAPDRQVGAQLVRTNWPAAMRLHSRLVAVLGRSDETNLST